MVDHARVPAEEKHIARLEADDDAAAVVFRAIAIPVGFGW